jgi:hypothetical protein
MSRHYNGVYSTLRRKERVQDIAFALVCVQQREQVMLVKRTLLFVIAVFIGFATSPSYGGDIIFCDGFESCPAMNINPAYLNTIVKDASGRILGSGIADQIINEKGYVLNVPRVNGLLGGLALVYDSPDCSGPGFISGYQWGGYVFSTTNINGDFDIRYSKKTVGPVYLSQTYKIANPGPNSSCIEGNTIGNYIPAFFNEAETTGVPDSLGSAENPYPIPLSFHRYGSS